MDGAVHGARVMNKRPLVLLAACLAAGIVLGRFVQLQTFYTIAAVALTAAAVCFFRSRALYFGCAVFLLTGAALSSAALGVETVRTGKAQAVSGHVYSVPYENESGSLVCLLGDARIDGQPCGDIRLYAPADAAIACGDVVLAVADTQLPAGVRNPGGFDERLYLLSQGVHYKAFAQTVSVAGTRWSVAVALARLGAFAGDTVDALFEADVAPAVRGMLFGDTRGIDENTRDAFRDSGLAHALSVSGLHAGILIAAVYGLFGLMRLGRAPRLIVTLVFIAAYTCAAGMVPPMVRAAIMAAVMLIGRHMGRQPDTLSNLALAFLISLLVNPLELFSVGFQLSYGAVFGLLTWGWQMGRALKKHLPAPVSGAISASVSATASTLPVTAAAFNHVSVVSVIANVVVLPLCSLAIVLCFATFAAGLVVGQPAQYLGFAAGAAVRLMLGVIKALGALPFAAADVASPPWYAVAGCYALLFIGSKYLLVRKRLKAVLGAGLAAVIAVVMLVSRPPGLYLVFLDVGQGDAAFLRTEQGGEYFFDGGRAESAREVVGFTVRQGITPDAAFVSHTDDDHFAGLVALHTAGLLDKVYCSWQEEATVSAAMPGAQVVPLGAGDVVLLDDVTRAVVLYPCGETPAGNDASLVLRVEYRGYSALLTGDISGLTETALFCAQPKVDIYKAAHHGSRFSSYRLPLSALSPAYSVISVGANGYGHPHAWAVENLAYYSGRVLITQDDHAVEFFIHEGITLNTYGGKDNGG